MNELALKALKEFEAQNGKLEGDDTIYLWHWFDDYETEHIRINTTNHSPEGIMCEVADLPNIDDWWDSEWDGEY
jgi:hypothetical protein